MMATWFVITADQVSPAGLGWLRLWPAVLVVIFVARRRPWWALTALAAALLVYGGPGLGGLAGISMVAIATGVSSLATAILTGSTLSTMPGARTPPTDGAT